MHPARRDHGQSVLIELVLQPLRTVGHALFGRQDLPIPEWLFAWAASLVLIVSFFALSVAWQTSRFEEMRWRPGPRLALGAARSTRWPRSLCGAIWRLPALGVVV